MSENKEKEYKLNIDPSILKTLGPQMYTNIYYVLSELVANAYDADATKVWVCVDNKENKITVEDNGCGMSKADLNEKYLMVAKESRTDSSNSLTPIFKRPKMGRKGLGKLAALSASENVEVMTMKDHIKNGLILSIDMNEDRMLKSLEQNKIIFSSQIDAAGHGTKIVMTNVKINIPSHAKQLVRNLLKILPVFSKDFVLNIKVDSENINLDKSGLETFEDLVTITTYGMDENRIKVLEQNNKWLVNKFIQKKPALEKVLTLKDKNNNVVSKTMKIIGWVGTMKNTVGTKKEIQDFPENYISIYANKKMGAFNILPLVGKNGMIESYIRGQLNVDLFEDSDLRDMALSNREGYQSTDLRWTSFLDDARRILDDAINLRVKYNKAKKAKSEEEKENNKKKQEEDLKALAKEAEEKFKNNVVNIVRKETGSNRPINFELSSEESKLVAKIFGLKSEIDSGKKKLLISHTSNDKNIVNLIYDFLKFNGVKKEEVIYTSSKDDAAILPENVDIFGYLRDFFVKSIAKSDMFVLYILSEESEKSWGATTEVGAGWITQTNDEIVVINKENKDKKMINIKPQSPLDGKKKYGVINLDDKGYWVATEDDILNLVRALEYVVEQLNLKPNDREENLKWWRRKDIVVIKQN